MGGQKNVWTSAKDVLLDAPKYLYCHAENDHNCVYILVQHKNIMVCSCVGATCVIFSHLCDFKISKVTCFNETTQFSGIQQNVTWSLVFIVGGGYARLFSFHTTNFDPLYVQYGSIFEGLSFWKNIICNNNYDGAVITAPTIHYWYCSLLSKHNCTVRKEEGTSVFCPPSILCFVLHKVRVSRSKVKVLTAVMNPTCSHMHKSRSQAILFVNEESEQKASNWSQSF